MEVNVHDAKTYLSDLLRRVENGEEITISRAGEPVAKLIAAQLETKFRPMGMDRGKIWMADDFDLPDAELEALFHGPITTGTTKSLDSSKNDGSKKKKKKKKA